MTLLNKIRKLIVLRAKADRYLELTLPDELETDHQVYSAYQVLTDADAHWDYLDEVREGQVETEIPAPSSRHYESRSVASQLPDGTWVGWTYWYGGGKHGDPGSIDWMGEAYELTCVETPQTIIARHFTKVEPPKEEG